MNRLTVPDHVPEVRRALVDVVRVCKELGIERSKTERGKWTCPRHGGGSLSVRLGRDRTIQARCFGCDFAGDVFTLIAESRGLNVRRDFPELLAVGARIGGLWALLAELEKRSGERSTRSDLTHRGSKDEARAREEPRKIPEVEKMHKPLRRLDVQTSERPYPPADEVRSLWNACVGVSTLDIVCDEIRRRAILPEVVESHDLARAIPENAALPRWTNYRGNRHEAQSWLKLGYRLVLPVYDALGSMRSVRGWRVVASDGPKRLPPSGYRASGLVMANSKARSLLERASWNSNIDGRIVIVEGEPDFLTWATRFSDNADAMPAIFGITSGSWSDELAARIPSGTRIIVRTHHDQAGNAYAARIGATLSGRCPVLRSKGTTR